MYVRVKVTPNAKKESFEQVSDDKYHISVREKAERNLANERVCNLIASKLDIPRKDIRIITGHHHPNKILFIKQ